MIYHCHAHFTLIYMPYILVQCLCDLIALLLETGGTDSVSTIVS